MNPTSDNSTTQKQHDVLDKAAPNTESVTNNKDLQASNTDNQKSEVILEKAKRVKDPKDAADTQHAEQHETPFAHLELKDRIKENCSKLMDKRAEIIEKLESLKKDIAQHYTTTRRTKTGSTLSNVVGTSLLFTPFAPLGVGMLGAGTFAGISTTVNDYMKSKKYNKGIEDILQEETPFAEELQDDLKMVMEAAEKLMKETGCSRDEAVAMVVNGLKSGSLSLTARSLASNYRWGEFKQGLDYIGRTVGGEGFGLAAKASATVMTKSLSVIGSAIDIADCLNTWKKNHPSIDMIDRVVNDLRSGIRELELLQVIFSNSK